MKKKRAAVLIAAAVLGLSLLAGCGQKQEEESSDSSAKPVVVQQESAELVKTIRNVQREFGLTVLLIEHDMKVIMSLCEYIYVMASGEIIASGTPEEIRSDPKVIAAYLGRQTNA